jgi:hypothetical protein
MSHKIKADDCVHEEARETGSVNGFDYNAPAELFPGRSKRNGGRVKYRRFDTVANALRFVFEEMPASALLGACLVVDETRFGLQEIRSLYESAAYPLTRPAVRDSK